MSNTSKNKRLIERRICRYCLSEEYGIPLAAGDCLYDGPYYQRCQACGRMRHIVVGLRLGARLKLMFR